MNLLGNKTKIQDVNLSAENFLTYFFW